MKNTTEDPNKDTVNMWIRDHGDDTLRLKYGLNPNSLVLDIGGYDGQWTKKIYDRYQCNIIFFEPVPEIFNKALGLLGKFDKIKTVQSAFSASDSETRQLFYNGDASSSFGKEGVPIAVNNTRGHKYISKLPVVDLVKINIEGDEYDLIEDMGHAGVMRRILNLQIQFHWNNIPDYAEKLIRARQTLSKTHSVTWNYDLVWENWRLLG